MTADESSEPVLIIRRTIAAPRERVFDAWISGSTDGRPTTVSIELRARADGTTDLLLTHRGLPERTFDAHEHGWTAIVDTLKKILT